MGIYSQDMIREDSMDPSSPPSSVIQSPFSAASPVLEDVTTIFVVGFPDDMQEREFQNMFVFAKGFEGASLKWHCKQDEETNENNKKQMIGFARFASRSEAAEAVEILNGRKVDIEKNSVFKAEMAKKNLHIKKGTNSSAVLPTTAPMTIHTRNAGQKNPKWAGSQYEPFSPIHDPFFRGDTLLNDAKSIDTRRSSIISPHSPFQQQSFHLFSKPAFMIDPEPDSFHYLSKSLPMSNFDSILDGKLLEEVSLSRKNSCQPNVTTSLSRLGTAAAVDQNPPCNTLYVGNLPSNTNQEELRSVFSKCEGYKRMSYRIKSTQQGPMCFVEFEDVLCATQAMTSLQAYMLSNSVKGGIRLSFSKNPLFIKPTKESDINFNFREMGAALLADL
ncbi:hypothetical protein G6F56_007968 [Rhizopus delemar]|uniref:RRM domain-containing protein n=1 Tax=Rhizopus stolonifer TaxID=4846 RepID=A0A367K8N1_RHIST|nr:hypothetical protein G6F56_007968 [Rhizopus delemar]RCH98574.1 hypothetical protein CU098_006414 [Rhizopus stolonifer]